ncbi:ECF transporter S component [Enterococcus ureasiticus]|uniref:ECF transporter S component n=1 Tax=Enterococcus ureasiticus TaxID=903984 RepID=A0A1E5GMF2_9ENTE|nr:ECF transporter S component [Enterococcus ureasiticus]OEG13866.1 ECF transporter S component [Enterococcus ureasiticus]
MTKQLTLTAMFIALSVIGSMFKITGSIALDSLPGFVGTVFLGPRIGFLLGSFGHLASATIAGFPLTIPVHLITAGLMACCLFCYGTIRDKVTNRYSINRFLAIMLAYLINTPLSLLFLYPLLGKIVYVLFLPLSVASLLNLILAEVVLYFLEQTFVDLSAKRKLGNR